MYYLILGVSIDDVDKVEVLRTRTSYLEAKREFAELSLLKATNKDVTEGTTEGKYFDVELLEVEKIS